MLYKNFTSVLYWQFTGWYSAEHNVCCHKYGEAILNLSYIINWLKKAYLGEREKVWLSKYDYAGQKKELKRRRELKKGENGNVEKKRIEKATV